MLDSRYLIVSLAAVFVALGLGVVIGFAMGGRDALHRQEQSLAARLEADFRRLLSDGQQLRLQLSEQQAALAALEQERERLADLAVAGRLTGRVVGLVGADASGGSATLAARLQAAGAEVVLAGPAQAGGRAPAAVIVAESAATLAAAWVERLAAAGVPVLVAGAQDPAAEVDLVYRLAGLLQEAGVEQP